MTCWRKRRFSARSVVRGANKAKMMARRMWKTDVTCPWYYTTVAWPSPTEPM